MNLNAILSVDDLLVPVLADFLSYDGLKILFETLRNIEDDFDYVLENIYIFLNRYNESMNISRRSRDALMQNYSDIRGCVKNNNIIGVFYVGKSSF
ncbi:Cell division protein PomZ [subsurface metagenome]